MQSGCLTLKKHVCVYLEGYKKKQKLNNDSFRISGIQK